MRPAPRYPNGARGSTPKLSEQPAQSGLPRSISMSDPSRGDRYAASPVKTTVEPLEGNKVRLSIEVDEEEFEPELEAAFRRLATEVRIPGFRPGKAPRRVLEARLGSRVGRDEAMRTALPDFLTRAVIEQEVDAISAPEIDITSGEKEGPVAFDAVVEVRPVIEVAGYQNLRVTIPSPKVTDDEVDEQIEHLRVRFGELETVDRAIQDGDFARIDVAGTADGEPVAGLTADDYLYEVGVGAVVPEIDEHLRGAKAGDIVEFDAAHPAEDDASLQFRILVKEVQARRLPDLDDAFAKDASEFETLAELRDRLTEQLRTMKLQRANQLLPERTTEALIELVDIELPDALIRSAMSEQLQAFAYQLTAQGSSIDQYLQITGRTQEQFAVELRESAIPGVQADLALRAVAEAEGLDVTDEQVDEEFTPFAEAEGTTVEEIRARFEGTGDLPAVRSDLRKRLALEWLVDRVEIVDEDGEPIDRSELQAPADDEPSADEPSSDDDQKDDSE